MFFKWYGLFFRKLLKKFDHIFVQNTESVNLLKNIGLVNVTLAGDTRFDRVRQITDAARDLPEIKKFKGDEKIFLAGSSWRPDEVIIANYINVYPGKMKWIFAPHEIDIANIERLEKLFTIKTVRYSDLVENSEDSRVLIIDNIGMLSSVYRYAFIAAVGGGFGKGIHNILEAASWGIPVVFGPNYEKFQEANAMIREGGAKTFSNYIEFESIINKWLSDDEQYRLDAMAAGKYVITNTGATDLIMSKIL